MSDVMQKYEDVGIIVMLKALRGVALEPCELTHTATGAKLPLEDPEARLSVIANALEPVIHLLEKRRT
jgi:hypothetical protein